MPEHDQICSMKDKVKCNFCKRNILKTKVKWHNQNIFACSQSHVRVWDTLQLCDQSQVGCWSRVIFSVRAFVFLIINREIQIAGICRRAVFRSYIIPASIGKRKCLEMIPVWFDTAGNKHILPFFGTKNRYSGTSLKFSLEMSLTKHDKFITLFSTHPGYIHEC